MPQPQPHGCRPRLGHQLTRRLGGSNAGARLTARDTPQLCHNEFPRLEETKGRRTSSDDFAQRDNAQRICSLHILTTRMSEAGLPIYLRTNNSGLGRLRSYRATTTRAKPSSSGPARRHQSNSSISAKIVWNPYLPSSVVTRSIHEVHYAAKAFARETWGAMRLSRMPIIRSRPVTAVP